MPIQGVERRLQHMVEGHLDRAAVAGSAVVEGDARSQVEGPLNLATGQVGHSPACSQLRHDHPVWPIGHKPLIDPVLDEELVGRVAVRSHLANATEHPSVGPWCDADGGRATDNVDGVHWVVELLRACLIVAQAAVPNCWHLPAPHGVGDGLLVHLLKDGPPLAAPRGLVLHPQDACNHLLHLRLGHWRFHAFHRCIVRFIARTEPTGGKAVRIIGGSPCLREAEVEVA
mmetsp:Transcript_48042/g.114174  ORF Transcript_48042/g.114174 Transcript_48042/m.114174 type:complete len:229 (-) Transcript_48042:306-992(-)